MNISSASTDYQMASNAKDKQFYDSIYYWCNLIFLSLILFLGIGGNTFTIVVLNHRKLFNSSFRFLLTILALSDLIHLFSRKLFEVLQLTIGFYDFWNRSLIACKIFPFISTSTFKLSPWILVVITVHRLISVIKLLKAKDIITFRKTVMTSSVLFFVMTFQNSYLLIFKGMEGKLCVMLIKYRLTFGAAHYTLGVVMGTFSPFVIMIGCNIIIVAKMKSGEEFRNKTSVSKSNVSANSMLTAITLAFGILTIPFSLLLVAERLFFKRIVLANGIFDPFTNYTIYRFFYLAIRTMNLSNYSLNFVFYVISGKVFRNEVMRLIYCYKGNK